jgi:hypothetical protein
VAAQPAPARVIVRFGAADPQPVLDALAAAGFEALDAVAELPRQQVA